MPSISQFYVLQAIVYLIIRTYFSSKELGNNTYYTLLYNIKEQDQKGLTKDSIKYYQFKPLILYRFNTYITILQYNSLYTYSILLIGVINNKNAFNKAISTLSLLEFNEIIEEIQLKAFTLNAQSLASKVPYNKEFQSIYYYL